MKEVVTENQLDAIELKRFDQVLVANSADDDYGVEVFRQHRIAEVYHPLSEAKVNHDIQLIVIVDNPADPATIERIRAKCKSARFD